MSLWRPWAPEHAESTPPHSHTPHLRSAWAGSQTQNQPQKAQSSAGRVCLWAVGFLV
jgi:hypothetical protein